MPKPETCGVILWFRILLITSTSEPTYDKSIHFSFNLFISNLLDISSIEWMHRKNDLHINLLWLPSRLAHNWLMGSNNNVLSLWIKVGAYNAKWCYPRHMFTLNRCSGGSLFSLPVKTCLNTFLFTKYDVLSEKKCLKYVIKWIEYHQKDLQINFLSRFIFIGIDCFLI